MGFRVGIAVLIVGVMALGIGVGVGAPARADTLETLVMPGPVTRAHHKVEGECSKCHAPFTKQAQKVLCVACHDKVGADIKAGEGFHGRDPLAATAECKTCHTEHKGRDFDIVGLNREVFDHTIADFKLSGAHLRTACAACHPGNQKFRDAPGDCFSCHEKDDAHKGAMGKKCASCHTAESWRSTAFDHSKTAFPLTGGHAKAQCSACHPNARYKDTPVTCVACHGLEDAHREVYGEKCDRCHTPAKWADATFDHSKTGFALVGRHGALQCKTCHTPAMTTAKLASGCIDCHRADDIHKGVNGPACRDCHGETSWKTVRFDHNKDTKFALRGAHKTLACTDCHIRNAHKVKLKTTCISCHNDDDPHKAQLGTACASCHGQTNWHDNLRFDHDLAAFPLLGLHRAAPCEACHLTAAFKDAGTDCVSCHGPDDIHKGAMGKECALCHNPNGWAFWQFDHNTQTKFALTGAHEGLNCKACHREDSDKPSQIATACVSCHAGDDIHAGRFGPRCDQCHGSDSFKNARIRR